MVQHTLLHHISKISLDIPLSYPAKYQLNTILLTITKTLIVLSVRLTMYAEKKQMTLKTLERAASLLLSGDLLTNALHEGRTRLHMDNVKESMTFPVEVFRQMTHLYAADYLKPVYKYPLYLACIVEYICTEILELSAIQAQKVERERVSPRDIYLAFQYDTELLAIYKYCKIISIRVGALPIKDKPKTQGKAIMLSKITYQKMIHKICTPRTTTFSKQALNIVCHYIETYLLKILLWADKKHDQKYIDEKDIEYVYSILN